MSSLKVLLIVWIAFLWTQPAHSDVLPINAAAFAPNVTEIQITDGQVDVGLEISVADLGVFKDLVPATWLRNQTDAELSLKQRLTRFAADGFKVTAGNQQLIPQLLRVEPRTRKDRGLGSSQISNARANIQIAQAPAVDRVMYAHLRYDLPAGTEELVFEPPLHQDGRPQASIGFITFHNEVPVTDFWYLTGPETLQLNWEDPWYSAFENKTLKRHHSTSALTFLYVDPLEIRHETLVRVRDLQRWVPFEIPEDLVLLDAVQGQIKSATEVYFLDAGPIEIDGVLSKPASVRSQFFEISTKGLVIVEEGQPINANTALIGVISSYPVDEIPKSVDLQWRLFSERLPEVQATMIDPAGPLNALLTPANPNLSWYNLMLSYDAPVVDPVVLPKPKGISIPVATILLASISIGSFVVVWRVRGRKRIAVSVFAAISGGLTVFGADRFDQTPSLHFWEATNSEDARLVFDQLLQQIANSSYEVRRERRDRVLSNLIDPQFHPQVISEIDRGLAVRVVGGGQAKTDDIRELEVADVRTASNDASFSALIGWTADASSSHWGHDHTQTIRYRALADVVYDGTYWRLAGLTVLEAQENYDE